MPNHINEHENSYITEICGTHNSTGPELLGTERTSGVACKRNETLDVF
jgi:hypothetical protein